MRVGVVTVLVTGLCIPHMAAANTVGRQATQLTDSRSYKTRLSAALSLSKTRDPRAIEAMIHALTNDSGTTIRRVAALSLSKMLDGAVSATLRVRALDALEQASKKDRSRRVRKSSTRALKLLARLPRNAPSGDLFLNIQRTKDATRRVPSYARRDVSRVLRRSLRRHVPRFRQRWAHGRLPTRAELQRTGTRAYFVAAKVSSVRVTRRGGAALVRCSLNVQVNPWSGRGSKEMWSARHTASAKGSGRVRTAANSSAISRGQRDCLVSVAEEITARQVVPFLQRLVASNP